MTQSTDETASSPYLLDDDTHPALEGLAEDGQTPYRIVLAPLPFVVGRASPANYVIHSNMVSSRHAEIAMRESKLFVRDLKSRNGTFVNGRKVDDAEIRFGDSLDFANQHYRVVSVNLRALEGQSTQAFRVKDVIDMVGIRVLDRIMRSGKMQTAFQPIVDLAGRRTFGVEALTRPLTSRTELGPADLLRLSEKQNQVIQLSQLMRASSLEKAKFLAAGPTHLFLNIHPTELSAPNFLETITDLPQQVPSGLSVVLEIHESAAAGPDELRQLRDDVHARGMEIAFDDVGAGRSRLIELAESPADYIKLDRSLVSKLEQSPSRQDLLRALCQLLDARGVKVIAEGIETEAELQACLAVGCPLGQGYLLGRPEPVSP